MLLKAVVGQLSPLVRVLRNLRLRDKLLSLARHCCIVMQTLRHGVPVDARLEALD